MPADAPPYLSGDAVSRREFSPKVMVDAFKRANGRCEKCTARLSVGKFAYDHIIPDQLGGDPTLDNCQVLCTACHSVKTRTRDVPAIAKAKRQERGQLLPRKRATIPGSRGTPWKRKIDGTTERRT
jgi:5-methylcytosine-specific restriction endonuclease McrA